MAETIAPHPVGPSRSAARLDSRAMARAEPAARVRPVGVLCWAIWLGLFGGLVELGAFLLKCRVIDPRNLNVSREFVWMYPLAGMLVATLLAGLPLGLAACVRRGGVSARVALAVIVFGSLIGPVFRLPVHTVACLVLAAGLAIQAGRVLGAPGRLRRFDRLVRASLGPALVMVGLVAAFGTTLGRRPATVAAAPPCARNVLLLVLDTVRAESLSLYGHDRPTSPQLERIATRGVRFDRAFSTAPWTAPSHASMFTGRWPRELAIGWSRPLEPTVPTLAEYLAARGYDTAGFVANTTYCSYETGLDRGFAVYRDYDVTPRSILLCSALVQRLLNFVGQRPALAARLETLGLSGSQRKPAARINGDLLSWLDARPAGAPPFFAFLNYYDAHHPYLAPEGPTPPPAELGLLRGWWGCNKDRLDPSEIARVRDAYERCIASLDAEIGHLFAALDARGLSRNTLVVITADHGEHLGEQRLYGHGVSLYRPELHVPLIVIDPGSTPVGAVVRRPASLRDVPATVVAQLGLDRESAAPPFPGASLARLWHDNGESSPPDAPVRAELAVPPEDDPNQGASPVVKGPMTSLVAWGYHYIQNGDGREELYDLEADPAESTDLAARSSPLLDRFRACLPASPP